MDSRNFLFLSIFLVVGLLAWPYFSSDGPSAPQPPAAPPAAAEPAVETSQVTVETPKYTAVFDERGGRLASFKLKNYRLSKTSPDQPDKLVELVTQPNRADWPLRLTLDAPGAPALEDAPFLADRRSLELAAGETGRLTLTGRSASGLTVVKTLTFYGDSFLVSQEVSLENGSGDILDGRLINRINAAPFQGGAAGRYDSLGAVANSRLFTETADDAGEALEERGDLPFAWVGYMDQYFLAALVPSDPAADDTGAGPPVFRAILQDHGGLAIAESFPLRLAPGQKAAFDFDFYYGPKAKSELTAAGRSLNLSVDMGWFSFIAAPLAALLRWMYGWVGNYGLAIIIVTILIKILLWPLTAKSYRSMKAMQKLQPKVARIREKYADDREALNREIMHLYKTFKVNPLGGCLPMLLQIPFFIAFYRVLDSLLELRGAPFIFWIKDLAAPDRLGALNFSIPFFQPPTGLPVLTILMGLSMYIQQKMTPNTMGDPTQAKIMQLMPLLFTFFLMNMPAGLVLYWLTNNILSIAQQTLINRPEK